MNACVVIDSGICGFQTRVHAGSEDGQYVILQIDSDCEKAQAFAAAVIAQGAVDGYGEIGAGADGVVLNTARQHLRGCCAGCVVPIGVFKAVQVAAGVALPKEVAIRMEVT